MNTTTTKTEQLIAACRTAKGATAEQLVEATGQTMQVVRSRLYTLTKTGRVAAVADTSPRRYKAAPAKK